MSYKVGSGLPSVGPVVGNLGRHTEEPSVVLAGNQTQMERVLPFCNLGWHCQGAVWITDGPQQASSHSVSCVLVPHIVCLRSLFLPRLCI